MLGPRRTASRLLWTFGLGRSTQTDASGTVTTVQGQFGGDRLLDRAKLVQQFGFASRPPANTDLVAVFPSGEPTSALVIATNSQAHRPPALEEGDAALHDVRGVYLWLTANGPVLDAGGLAVMVQNAASVGVTATDHVTLTAPTVTVTASTGIKLDTPMVEATHALEVDGAATGTFVSQDGKHVTVEAGVVTSIL